MAVSLSTPSSVTENARGGALSGNGLGGKGAERSPDRFIDPRALMRIRSLELRARVVVEGFLNGLHRSPYHGFSVEFTEYRPYSPGDDPRYLDWRVLARSDRTFIKKFEDETNLRCHLLVDRSRSMDFSSTGYSKGDYAVTLAATLAHFLQKQGDAVGLFSFDEAVREYLPARARPGHLRQLMLALEKPAAGKKTDLVAPLTQFSRLVRKRGLMVLISDFLAPLDRLESSLATLSAGGHEAAVFQLLDPAEKTLGFSQSMVFEDLESAQTLYIDPAAARASYVERLTTHNEAVRGLCARHGIAFTSLQTDQPLEWALFEFLQRRERSEIQRRGNPSSGRTP
ncbi:MAG TPA: DUF58 domain-containing protein [Opitutaceae bacterium]|nr:DUF58 domain-containing protein [Opitutaceae bacterium]